MLSFLLVKAIWNILQLLSTKKTAKDVIKDFYSDIILLKFGICL